MKKTKTKMNEFLNSFENNITIWTKDDDVTHKNIDHKKGIIDNKNTTTQFSTITFDELSGK
jgi:hypothetical protein